MNKFISAIILLALSSVSLNAFSAADKVEVCHKGQEINVAMSSLSAHKAHGDTVYDDDDEDYDCDGTSTKPDPKTKAAVMMMRCDAIEGNGVVVVSASTSVDLGADFVTILPIPLPIPLPNPPVEPYPNCAKALGALLNAGFVLRSINSGSAEDDDDNILKLYTDYLLIGRILVP
jgi:hypothetical protein